MLLTSCFYTKQAVCLLKHTAQNCNSCYCSFHSIKLHNKNILILLIIIIIIGVYVQEVRWVLSYTHLVLKGVKLGSNLYGSPPDLLLTKQPTVLYVDGIRAVYWVQTCYICPLSTCFYERSDYKLLLGAAF